MEAVLPLIIKGENGAVLDTVYMNLKGFRKSIENATLWVLATPHGRLLPYSDSASFLKLVDKERWYEAIVSESFAVNIVDNCAQPVDNVQNSVDNGDFNQKGENSDFSDSVLGKLEAVIHQRHIDMPEGSYTTHLFKSGGEKIRKKTGEEAIELILALKKDEIIYEAADLVYHMMVLLESEDISILSVIEELAKRD